MNFATIKLKKELQNDPRALVSMVVENNPRAVALAFRGFAGQTVNTDDPDQLYDTLVDTILAFPQEADNLVYNLLNVPIIEQNLSPVGKDFVLNELIDAEVRQTRSGIFDTSIGELNEEVAQSGSASTSTNGGGSAFNWGPIISSSIPGILAAFGITQAQNPNSAAPITNNEPTVNWMIIILVVIVLAIVGYAIYRATR